MIDRLPKCLQTCLHCRHGVILEQYSHLTKELVFDGCWKFDNIQLPVAREDCPKFEESKERIETKFWQKWKWKVYVDGNLVESEKPEQESDEICGSGEQGEKSCELFKGVDSNPRQPINEGSAEICEQLDGLNETCVIATPDTDIKEKDLTTTRSLILQALANNISRLKDIARFAGVDPSTAHYHLGNLMREERVSRISWGHYAFSGGEFLKNGGKTFDKLLKNFSQPIEVDTESEELHPVEKNILMDILSKDNKYEPFSERELARRSNVTRYIVRKYTNELEKKKLIKIKREITQFVFVPTEIAVNGLTEFFQLAKGGSKIDRWSSKIQPENQPVTNSKIRPITDPDRMETFDEYIAWQQKNAHRFIIQFKLIRCSHERLKKTGWIFDQKSIHKHFTEAYIYKSKDPSREVINVLPKNPFIFTSEFDFHQKMVDFVNETVSRLREYGIVIDLSEPAEIRMQHEAVEDDPFARKVIERGLLYFKSEVKVVDSTGEIMEYVTAIDKSKKLHFEFEGTEAHYLTANLEAFVDDVVCGKIDSKDLREIPQRLENMQNGIKDGLEGIGEKLNSSIQRIQNTQILLHQNQLEFSQNLVSHVEMVQKIGEAAESVRQAVDIIREVAKILIDVMRSRTSGYSGEMK